MSGPVQISPQCQDSTDIPQMSGTVQISPRQYDNLPKCQDSTAYPPNVRTVQISLKCPIFCRVECPTLLHKRNFMCKFF
ncbi:unnamed protein product [Staurois parvus]|uniref:Uncharacterized protein n=1 Tax=Staurois parvus TaxID=386267 RepID=A0ABN9FYV4_9NEOB|nr:unnamed protein product [Staurois parvus]